MTVTAVMARHPDPAMSALPVEGTTIVVGAVPDVDRDPNCLRRARECAGKAGDRKKHKNQFYFHIHQLVRSQRLVGRVVETNRLAAGEKRDGRPARQPTVSDRTIEAGG